MSLARTAGLRRSRQASGLGLRHWSGGMVCDGGPIASWMTLRPVTSVLSARLADQLGQFATAVTKIITKMAQPAVVRALLMSDWRDRQSRYRPTTHSVTAPKTVNTFL